MDWLLINERNVDILMNIIYLKERYHTKNWINQIKKKEISITSELSLHSMC